MEASPPEYAVLGARTCATCGYDLRGQVEPRCPECGTGFDPTGLTPPPIPWLLRGERDVFGAYWATVAWVLRHPRGAGRTIAAASVYLDLSARGFRRLIVRHAVAAAMLLILFTTVRALADPRGGAILGVVVVAALFPGVALFFWAATHPHSTPRWWWSRPLIADHAEALQHYALAPLALLPLASVLEALAMTCALAGQVVAGQRVHQLALIIVAGVTVAWWACTMLMMHASRIWDRSELAVAGALLPVRWFLLAMLVATLSFFLSMCIALPAGLLLRG
jgi:hypothetical protein